MEGAILILLNLFYLHYILAPDNQHPQPDSSEGQEEQLVELKAKMGILSLSEGKVRSMMGREERGCTESIM